MKDPVKIEELDVALKSLERERLWLQDISHHDWMMTDRNKQMLFGVTIILKYIKEFNSVIEKLSNKLKEKTEECQRLKTQHRIEMKTLKKK